LIWLGTDTNWNRQINKKYTQELPQKRKFEFVLLIKSPFFGEPKSKDHRKDEKTSILFALFFGGLDVTFLNQKQKSKTVCKGRTKKVALFSCEIKKIVWGWWKELQKLLKGFYLVYAPTLWASGLACPLNSGHFTNIATNCRSNILKHKFLFFYGSSVLLWTILNWIWS
jgi:hypothetical protein